MPLLLSATPPTTPPIPPHRLGKYLLHISTETQRDRSSFLSLMLVKVSIFSSVKYITEQEFSHDKTNFFSVWHPEFSYQITERDQIFKDTVYDTKTANKKKTCKQ